RASQRMSARQSQSRDGPSTSRRDQPRRPSELVGRTQFPVETHLWRTLRPAVAHDVGDLRLVCEELLEALLVWPFVDDKHLVVVAGEGVPDRSGSLSGRADALHHFAARSGGVALKIRRVAGDSQDRDYRHMSSSWARSAARV